MSTKGYPAPLTWDRLLELAAQGHDHYDAALTSDRARQLVASVRENFLQTETAGLERQLTARYDAYQREFYRAEAANATLERVRDLADSTSSDGNTWVYLRDLRAALAALAGQPEAPKGQDWHETAKEIAQRSTADFSAAKRQADAARGCPQHGEFIGICQVCPVYRDLVAVKARIAELETQHDADLDAIARAVRHEDAANARADAAERERKVLEEIEGMKSRLSLSVGCSSHYPHDLSEQGCEACQLKSQLAQVEIEAEVSLAVTNHERKVLTAMGEIQIERSSFGNLYMVPKGLQPLLEAELANRAAKAKK
jgi:hypothetical protein